MKQIFTLLAAVLLTATTYAQVGIGTTTPAGALDVVSTTSGFVMPRVANTSVVVNPNGSAIENGTMVYDLSANCVVVFLNGGWTGCIQSDPTAPGAPVIGTATAGVAQATVSFTAPVNNGGSVITSYTATSSPSNITGTLSQSGSGTITVTGLADGTAYTFTVTATNAIGTSAASTASNSVMPAPSPTSQVSNGAGGFYTFLSYNLGADISIDPHTPVVGLQGGYVQWGKRGPTDFVGAANNGPYGFAAAPTASAANDAAISGWSETAAADGSWNSGTEAAPVKVSANDPCPDGYRVPTRTEWVAVNTHNTFSRTGTFTESSTNYGSASHYGTAGGDLKQLTLPAAGYRYRINGVLNYRGSNGTYWSSTESGSNAYYLFFSGSLVYPAENYSSRTNGFSVRCIAE